MFPRKPLFFGTLLCLTGPGGTDCVFFITFHGSRFSFSRPPFLLFLPFLMADPMQVELPPQEGARGASSGSFAWPSFFFFLTASLSLFPFIPCVQVELPPQGGARGASLARGQSHSSSPLSCSLRLALRHCGSSQTNLAT